MDRRDVMKLLGAGASWLAAGGCRSVAADLQQDAISSPRIAASPRPTAELLKRPIPSSREELPVIGLGTWQTFNAGTSARERAPLAEVLTTFVDLGGRVIDSSPMYGRAEGVIGDLAADANLRPKLFLATKVWTSGRAAGVAQMEESLRRMRTDVIDLMQVHNLLDVETHLATLREWRESGRVRYIGVTHYTAGSHDAVAHAIESHAVDFIQINYSVAEREAERRLLPLARERRVGVIANRPFAGGEVLSRLKEKPLPAWANEIDCASWAQLLLKFVVSHPSIVCAIPATSKVAHLRDNMQAGHGRLPDSALREQIVKAVYG